jgi:outer membrane protein assembly factor BamE
MIKFISIISLTLLVTGCTIYKMEVQQGNALSNETVSQLQRGMSKDQVAALLGNPLLQDNFRRNRWDYVYYNLRGKEVSSKKQNLTLFFQNDQLIQVKK